MKDVFSRALVLICMVLIGLSIGCSSLSSIRETKNAQKAEVPESQLQKLNEQIRSGQYQQILRESSEGLQSGISEDLFVKRMKKAVEKMKEVDETLNFQKGETSDFLPKSLLWTAAKVNLEKDNNGIGLLTQWTRENEGNPFKLSSLAISPYQGEIVVYNIETGTVKKRDGKEYPETDY